jgi:hypothetical protein
MKIFTIISLLFLCFFTGCELSSFIGPGISGAINGYVSWKNGEAHKYYNLNKDIIYRSTKRACGKLGYAIIKEESSKTNYKIIAGKNDRFKITIKSVESNITELSVRVNTMGDIPYTELLYKEIDKELNIIHFNDKGHPVKFKRLFSR